MKPRATCTVKVPINPKVWTAAKAAADREGISVDEFAMRAVRETLKRRNGQKREVR